MKPSGLIICQCLSALVIWTISVHAEESWNISEVSRLYSHWDIVHDFIATDGFVYAASGGTGVNVLNTNNPESIVETANIQPLETGGSIISVAYLDQTLYVGDGITLRLFDVTDQGNPLEISSIALSANIIDITPWQAYALCLTSGNTLEVIDLNTPESPVEISTLELEGSPVDMVILENHAYISTSSGIISVNLEEMEEIEVAGFFEAPGVNQDIFTDGTNLILIRNLNQIVLFDPSDPTDLDYVETYFYAYRIDSIAFTNEYVYVTFSAEGGQSILSACYYADGYEFNPWYEIDVSAPSYHIYIDEDQILTMSNDRLSLYDRTNPLIPFHAGHLNDVGFVSDVARNGNIVYIADEEGGVRIVDISDPEIPIENSTYVTPEQVTGVAFRNSHLFLTLRRQGYMILDVSDPTAPVLVAQFSFSDDARKLLIQDDLLFCVDEGNRINILNISEYQNPIPISEITLPFMTVFDLYYENQVLYVIEGTTRGIRMYDLRIPAAPVFLNEYNYPSCRTFIKNGDYGYLAASWYLLVLEMSNPTNPQLVTTINTHGSEIKEMAIEDNFLLLTKYRGGIEVFSLADPEHPGQTGFHQGFWSTGLSVQSPFAYVGDGASLRIFDYSDALYENKVQPFSLFPEKFTVGALYPNPFNSTINVTFSLPISSPVSVSLINSLGQSLYETSQSYSPGKHLLSFNAENYTSGVYFIKVDAFDESHIQKAILTR